MKNTLGPNDWAVELSLTSSEKILLTYSYGVTWNLEIFNKQQAFLDWTRWKQDGKNWMMSILPSKKSRIFFTGNLRYFCTKSFIRKRIIVFRNYVFETIKILEPPAKNRQNRGHLNLEGKISRPLIYELSSCGIY